MAYRKRKPVGLLTAVILLVIFLPIAYFVSKNPRLSEAAWFDDTFTYRQTVPITNSGSSTTNQYVKVTLDTAALITAGKMQSDCDDIRVTNIQGKLLTHFVDGNSAYTCNDSDTSIYVLIDSIPSSGTNVFLYYGNSSASTVEPKLGTIDFPAISCQNILQHKSDSSGNGQYYITPSGKLADKIQVTCDMTTSSGGWIKVYEGLCTSSTSVSRTTGNVVEISSDYLTFNQMRIAAKNWDYSDIKTTTETAVMKLTFSGYYQWLHAQPNTPNPDIQFYSAADGIQDVKFTSLAVMLMGYGNSWRRILPHFYTQPHDSYMYLGSLGGVGINRLEWGGTDYNTNMNATSPAESGKGLTPWQFQEIYVWVRENTITLITDQSASTPTNEEISPAPIAYWKFDEGYGTVAHDSSYGNLDGTIGGTVPPVWKTEDQCISGKCLYFDGSNTANNGKVTIQENSTTKTNIVGDVTISVWIKPTSNYYDTAEYVIRNGQGADLVYGVSYDPINKRANFSWYDGSFRGVNGITNSVPLNEWSHITMTRTGGNAYIYINGVLSNSGAVTTPTVLASEISIGQTNNAGVPQDFTGFIDELIIYPYARTAAQIKADYASRGSTKGTSVQIGTSKTNSDTLSNGLVGYWKMDETSGNITDSSGNNNTGTVTGSNNFGSGKFGNSFRAGNAGTNMITNPSLETGITSWNYQYVSQGSAAASTDRSVLGSYSLKITRTVAGSEANVYNNVAGLANSTVYYFSTWAWASTPNTACVFSYNAGVNLATICHSGSSQWERIGGTFTTSGAGVVQLRLAHSSTNLGSVYFDGMQVEIGSTISPYIDGTLGTGYSWTGTAHASTSTRTASTAVVTNSTSLDITSNTISFGAWINPTLYPDTYSVIFQKNGYTAGYRMMLRSTGKIYVGIGETSGGTLTSTGSIPKNVWSHVLMTYDGLNIKIYINGVLDSSLPYTNSLLSSANAISFGSTEYPFLTGFVDETRIYNRALSPAEVNSLFSYSPPPVAYYPFDEGNGTITNDKSGNGRTATLLNGASWAPGKFGKAVKLNIDTNSNQYLSVSSNVNHSYTFTKEAWINPTSISGCVESRCSILSPYFEISGTSLQYYNYQLTPNGWYTGGTIRLNQWQHIAVSFDGSYLRLYIDGIQVNSTASTQNGAQASTGIIGAHSSNSRTFKGYIDEVRIYDYARTPGQITQDMNASHPLGGSPIGSQTAYWKFEEGSGTKANNSGNSSPSLQLTVNNATWSNNGKFGKALLFDGSSTSYATTSYTALTGQSAITISAWINSSNISTSQNIISQNGPYFLQIVGSKVIGRIYTNSTYTSTPGGATLSNNTWYHVALVYDGSIIKIYINGILDNQIAKTGTLGASNTLYIGRPQAVGYEYPFFGLIDEIKLYSAALTAEEIKLDYNQGSATVFGSSKQTISGTTTSLEYCIPGDTSSCSAPIAEWNFEEGSGTTTNDTSGNNNHGVFGAGTSAPSWSTGKVGKALSFDGTNDQVSGTINISNITNAITASAWVYRTGSGIDPGNPVFVDIASNGGANGARLYHDWVAGVFHYKWIVKDNGSWATCYVIIADNEIVERNKWTFMEGTYDGSKAVLYKNGVEIGRSNCTGGNIQFNGTTFNLGSIGSSYLYTGKLDNVRIYNYARTPAQISYDYNKGAPVGHWKLDECQGSSINDSSGNNNTGTLTVGATGTNTSAGTCTGSAGESWKDGAIGKYNSSLEFDGTDDLITVPSSSTLNFGSNDFTISFYTYKTATGFQGGSYINKGTYTGGINTYDNIFRVNTSGGELARVTLNATQDIWQHHTFVVTQNSTPYIKHYINGILDNTGYSGIGNLGTFGSDGSNLVIGYSNAGGPNRYFNGQIDDVRIYNYALTLEQIKQVYTNGAINFGPATGTPQ